MKNNQFKRVIRQFIERHCEKNNIVAIYVDISNNERVCYLYNDKYKVLCTLNMYLNDDGVRIRYSTNKTKCTNIVNKDFEERFSYMELDKVQKCMDKMFKTLLIKTKGTR